MKFFAASLDRFRKHPKLGDDTSDRIGVVKVERTDSAAGHPPVQVSQHREQTVVSVGAIVMNDLAEVRDLGAWLIDFLESESPKVLVVDLGRVTCLSSETLNQLINVNCHARERGTRLVLSNLCDPLLEVFRITRLDRLFEVAAAD